MIMTIQMIECIENIHHSLDHYKQILSTKETLTNDYTSLPHIIGNSTRGSRAKANYCCRSQSTTELFMSCSQAILSHLIERPFTQHIRRWGFMQILQAHVSKSKYYDILNMV